MITGQTRHLSDVLPGQAIRAPNLTQLHRMANNAQARTALADTGTQLSDVVTVHFLQGIGTFPAAGKNFGYDIWPNCIYTLTHYSLYCSSGSFTVQMNINGVRVGPVIDQTIREQYGIKRIDLIRYSNNKRVTLDVITKSGTVKDFCLVFFGKVERS